VEVITIESEAYKNLIAKMDAILQSKSDAGNSIFDEYVSNEDFIKLLGITKHTAVNYRNKGLITYYQFERKIYYKKSDIDAFFEKFKVKSFAKPKGIHSIFK
jgi:hypothetical protein